MRIPARAVAVAALLLAGGDTRAAPAADPAFEARWRDGRAELDGYRLVVDRYGAPRAGQGVLVYVTEPFGARERVKVDDPARHRGDVLDVLKLNAVRDFQTGIYDYNTMVSTFVRVADLVPIKVSFSSAEWCGHVYEEMLVDPGGIRQQVFSYFEGESGARTLPRPAGGVLEDELLILLRGLHRPWLEPGEKRRVPYLAGAFWRRLAHRPAVWGAATIERLAIPERVRVPAGVFTTSVYVVTADDGREGRFNVELADPRRIVRWAWRATEASDRRAGPGGTDRGELTGSARLPYWKLHGPGDEHFLDTLGLAPTVR